MSIYIAHCRKNNASNALNVPSSVQKETSSVYDENSQFACPAHANCFRTSSMLLVQQQRRCDGRTYRAETVEERVISVLILDTPSFSAFPRSRPVSCRPYRLAPVLCTVYIGTGACKRQQRLHLR